MKAEDINVEELLERLKGKVEATSWKSKGVFSNDDFMDFCNEIIGRDDDFAFLDAYFDILKALVELGKVEELGPDGPPEVPDMFFFFRLL